MPEPTTTKRARRGRNPRERRLRAQLFVAFDGRCAYCRVRLWASWTVDHVIPRSRGGADAVWNRVPACIRCNRLKGNHEGPAVPAVLRATVRELRARGEWLRETVLVAAIGGLIRTAKRGDRP